MGYIGHSPVKGDSANTFKSLDNISSFTLTFDAGSTDVVSVANDTLTFANHRFVTGQRATYTDGGGTVITGLTDGTAYFIIKVDQNTIKLATNASNAANSVAIDLTGVGSGGSHTLNVAFDGVNTRFKATHTDGIKAKVTRPQQISLSINGVIQQPVADYGVEADATIAFSSAPSTNDKIFATFIGEVAASFDIADNTISEFTGDGSTTTYNLSQEVSSSNDILVTLDGVTQYPNTQTTTRAYQTTGSSIIFTSAPDTGVVIQVRHIGFGGASSQSVTGFYGRTGNVSLKSTDDVTVNDLTVTGDLSVTGDISYDEATARNLDVSGIATFQSGLQGIGIQSAGLNMAVGVITALNFVGSGNTFLYNTSTNTVDISIAGGAGGAVGAGTDKIFYESDQTVTQSYFISTGRNAMVAGPLAIASDKTVTIPSGSELTIV